MNLIDLTGKRFGRLLVISRSTNRGNRVRWSVECDCGKQSIKASVELRKGETKSCGCLRHEVSSSRRKYSEDEARRKKRIYAAWYRRTFPNKATKASAKSKRRKPEHYRVYFRNVARIRRKDVEFRILAALRSRIHDALKQNRKSHRTLKLLGCSLEDFRIYLESRFKTGMTWENYGSVWEIDHIIPCALFDLTRADHQRACFHFSNMRPLFVKANRKKGHRCDVPQLPLGI